MAVNDTYSALSYTGATWRANRVAYAGGFSTMFVLGVEREKVTQTPCKNGNNSDNGNPKSKLYHGKSSRNTNVNCKVTFMLQNHRHLAMDGVANGAGL